MGAVKRYFLACSILLVAACGTTSGREEAIVGDANTTDAERQMPARFLALGDSYTIGESVAPDQRWPVVLVEALRDEGVEIGEPRIIAKTGWTTDELAAAVQDAELREEYDLVSLMVGVNNQYRGRSVDNYRDELAQLLKRAVRLAGGSAGRVILVSIPDWGMTPFARKDERGAGRIADEIAAFNRVGRELATLHGVRYVNVTDISREVPDDPSLVAEDGLHPSARQYQLWTKRILPVAREILEGR